MRARTTARTGRKLVWVVDARVETNPVPDQHLPAPPGTTAFAKRGGRFGAHNLHENLPVPTSWQSDTIIIGTFFNAGRARLRHQQSVPAAGDRLLRSRRARSSRAAGAIQLNDVYVDDRRIVYTVDRFAGGLYILEMTI